MINGKIIKVCGMREAPNIRDVESLQKVDMIGFIFYPKSPRYIYELPAYLPVRARRVGVFVNEDKDVITMYADRFGLEYIQAPRQRITGILSVIAHLRPENHQSFFCGSPKRFESRKRV